QRATSFGAICVRRLRGPRSYRATMAVPTWQLRRPRSRVASIARRRSRDTCNSEFRILNPELVDLNCPRITVAVLDAHVHHRRPLMRESVRPFDGRHTGFERQFVESQIVNFDRPQAIEVDVMQWQASTAIFLDQRERGAADQSGIDAEALGES